MKKISQLLLMSCLTSMSVLSFANATQNTNHFSLDLQPKSLQLSFSSQNKMKGVEDVVLSFHVGDRIPVTLNAHGDLLETEGVQTLYLFAKRDFFLKIIGSDIMFSFDGEHYKPIHDAVSGLLDVTAASDQNGTQVSIDFNALIK